MKLKHLLSKKNLWFFLSLMGLAMASFFTACSGDDDEVAGYIKVVTVKEDGTTSDGSRFVQIDDMNFYLNYIKYTLKKGYLVVSGYDDAGFDGVARIVSGVNLSFACDAVGI